MSRELGRIATGWVLGSLLLAPVGVTLCAPVADAQGTIAAWGDNSYGQCTVPAPNSGFVAVAGGESHSLGLKADGSIVAWGLNGLGQCNVPAPNSGFVAVAGGYAHSLAVQTVQATGACCYSDGTCAVTTQAECMAVWHAEWTSCEPNLCPQPTGACCYPDGSCSVTTQADCTGIWHPEWADCNVAQCPQPTAACCYPDGSCAVTTEADCAGIWHPEWPDCNMAQCEQPEVACCFPSGICAMLMAAECTAAGGTPGVYGSDCTPNECPLCVGDLNCDGVVDFGDINPFVLILSNPVVWQQTYPGCPWQNGDINGNGAVGFEDINPFVALIVQSPIVCQY